MSQDKAFRDFPGYLGWVPDKPDDKDFQFSTDEEVSWPTIMNIRAEFPGYFIGVYNQLATGSCTANAVAAAYSYEYNRRNAVRGDNRLFPARSFIYYNARTGVGDNRPETKVKDGGSAVRLAMRSLQKWGVCTEVSWPFREVTIEWYPGPYPYFEALQFRVPDYTYKRLDVKRWDKNRDDIIKGNDVATMKKDGEMLLKNLRACLHQGHPVVFGIKCYFLLEGKNNSKYFHLAWNQSDNTISKWTLKRFPEDRRNIGPATDPNAKPSAHAVLAVGFWDDKDDKTRQNGWVLCQNSWGDSEPGKEVQGAPLFWCPYSYITDFTATQDFWMMDLSQKPPTAAKL